MPEETNGASAEAAESTLAPLSDEDEAVLASGEFTEEEIAQVTDTVGKLLKQF